MSAASVIPRTIAAPAPAVLDPHAAALTGQAIAAAGDATAKFADAMTNARDETATVNARLAAAQKLDDLHQQFLTDPDPATAPQRFRTQADQIGADLINTIRIPQNRASFTADFGNMVEGRRVSIMDHSFARESADALASLNTAGETYSRQAAYATNPVERQAAIDAYRNSVSGVVAKGMLNPEAAGKMVQGFSEKLSLYDGRTLVTSDPAAAAKHLADKKFLPDLDPLARVELQSQADTELRVREREARAAMAEARANARAAISDFNSVTGTGLPVSPDLLDQTRAAVRASGDPHLANQFARSIQAANFSASLRGASPQEVEAKINELDASAAQSGADQPLAAAEKGARAYLTKMNSALAHNPLDWAARQGVVQIAPLKLDGTDNATDWQARIRAGDLAAQHYRTRPVYITPDEAATLHANLDVSKAPDERLQMVHMLIANMGDRALPVIDAATRPAGSRSSNTGSALAVAGGLLADGPAYVPTARDIAHGEAALKARPELKPKLDKFPGEGDVTLDNLRTAYSQLPQDYARVVDAAQAIYAKQAGDAGYTGADVSGKGAATMAQALDLAAGAHWVNGVKQGGVALYNGAPIIAPNNVASENFEDLVHHLTPADLARASVTGAKPVIDGKDVPGDVLRNSWLVTAGSNRYAISATDPSKGQISPLRDEKGQVYRLDFARALTFLQARASK